MKPIYETIACFAFGWCIGDFVGGTITGHTPGQLNHRIEKLEAAAREKAIAEEPVSEIREKTP